MLKLSSVLLVMLVCATCLPALAQTSDAERIKQLEEENERLRRELAQLRLELSTLKKQLAEQSRPAEPSDTTENNKPIKNAEPAEQVDPDAENVKVKTFRSADDICRVIPQEFGPGRDGWDVFKRKSVSDWLNQSIPGSSYEARRKIKSTAVNYDKSKNQWMLKITFEPEDMRYMNWEMKETLSGVDITGDEKQIEQLKSSLRAGVRVRVTGTIDRFNFDVVGKKTDEDWRPTICTIGLRQAEVH